MVEKTFAARFREARLKKGWSQAQLAEAVTMSQQGIDAIENGHSRNTPRILDLARALEVEPDWLLTGQSDPKTYYLREPEDGKGSRDNPDNATTNKFAQNEISILGTTATADGRYMVIGEPIATTFRHPAQIGMKGAFALHVLGIAAQPRYNAGELVYALNTLSPIANQDVIILLKSNQAIIRKYIKTDYSSRQVECLQYANNQTEQISLDEIGEIWPIVGRR